MSQELRHTLGVIDEAFSRLRAEILIMAAQTRTNLINAINGLFERDTALCNQAIADDSDVDLLIVMPEGTHRRRTAQTRQTILPRRPRKCDVVAKNW